MGLSLIHINLTWKLTENVDYLITSVLVWVAIWFLLWKKEHTLTLESGTVSSFLGILLIIFVLLKSASVFWFETSFLRIFAIASTLGLGLLASGSRGLKQYWREFILVSLLVIPDGMLTAFAEKVVNISLLTAQWAAFILWCTGFEVSRQGVTIFLPTGGVTVGGPCAGAVPMFLLLRVAIIYLGTFPVNLLQIILVPISAVLIAFVVNGVRIALLTVIVANFHEDWFSYWHSGEGSQLFSLISALVFGLLCSFLARQNESQDQNSVEL